MKTYKKTTTLEFSLGLIAIGIAVVGFSHLVEKLIKDPASETQRLLAQCAQILPSDRQIELGQGTFVKSENQPIQAGRHTFIGATYEVVEGPKVIDETSGVKIFACPEEVISNFKQQLGTRK